MTKEPSERSKGFLLALIALLVVSFVVWRLLASAQSAGEYYHQYTFRATRKLVQTVTEAQKLLEAQGPAAFAQLDRMKSEQLGMYLYVYRTADAMCLYHGETPDQVGTRLDAFHDQLGKPMHQLVTEAINNPLNPHGWVHYYWPRPQDMFVGWKSSCNLAATFPDGTKVYVGGGIYGLGAEVEFARIAVAGAVQLLRTEGEQALTALTDPTGKYFFHNSGMFVLRENGDVIVDPVLQGRVERNLIAYRDAMERLPFRHLLRKLKTHDSAQVPLYASSPTSMNPDKKIIYAERGELAGEPIVVGTIIDAPHSVWMR